MTTQTKFHEAFKLFTQLTIMACAPLSSFSPDKLCSGYIQTFSQIPLGLLLNYFMHSPHFLLNSSLGLHPFEIPCVISFHLNRVGQLSLLKVIYYICRSGRNKHPKCPQTAQAVLFCSVKINISVWILHSSWTTFPVVQGRCNRKSESQCKTRAPCCIPQPLSHLRRKNSKEFGVWQRELKQCCDHTQGGALCNSSALKNHVQNTLRVMLLNMNKAGVHSTSHYSEANNCFF